MITSITKKILVALVGGFLLFFLLFHMLANLCLLRDDGGLWYTNFCHFMSGNIVVKIMEIILFATLFIHIVLTIWLWIGNRKARPVRYRHASRTKTDTGSKLMIWTGVLIIFGLLAHFGDFFFAKVDGPTFEEPTYMVDSRSLMTDNVTMLINASEENNVSPDEFIDLCESWIAEYAQMHADTELFSEDEAMKSIDDMYRILPVVHFLEQHNDILHGNSRQWLRGITGKEREMLEGAIDGLKLEPDFYTMARGKFADKRIAVLYLIFFVVLWFHLRHAFSSAFQTLGLTGKRYFRAIEIIGIIYTCFICLGFAAVPIGIQLM